MRVGFRAEQQVLQFAVRLRRESGQVACGVELVEYPELAALTEIGEYRLRGAAAHGSEGVECAGRKARQGFFEEDLHLLRQEGIGKFLTRTLDLRELRRQLDP